MDLKESSCISYYSAFLFLSFGGILNTLPLLEIYLKVLNDIDQEENQLELVLGQLSVAKYLFSSTILHHIYIIIIFSSQMLILLILIILLYRKFSRKFDDVAYSNYGQFLLLLIQPLFWSISGVLFQILNTYLKSFQTLSYIFFLDIVAIITLNLLLYFLVVFFYFDHTQKKNFLKINQLRSISIYKFLIFFSGFQELFINDDNELDISFSIILFILYSILYVSLSIDKPIFLNSSINQYFSMLISIQFSLTINLLLVQCVYMSDEQYFAFTVLTFFLLIQLNLKIRYILVINEIENYSKTKWIEQQTINYLKQHSKYYFLLRGLLQFHQSVCLSINCFCRVKCIYKISSKGNKKILINRQTIADNLNRISSFFLKCVYESKLKTTPEHKAKYLLIELLCFNLKLSIQALVEINKLNFEKVNIIQKININNIRIFVDRQYVQKNQLSYKTKLPFDFLLQCEKYIKETVQIMIDIFGYQLEFWNYSLSLQINLSKELKIIKKIYCLINKFEKIAKKILSLYNEKKVPIRNKQWFNYYFYKLFVLNKKLKINELELIPNYKITLEQILKDDFADEKSSDEEISNNYFSQKFLISANTCVIQINNQNIIKNCTNSTFQLLNKTKENLLNRSATIIMPSLFKSNHQLFIHHFQQTGECYNLFKRRKAFCLHENGSIIVVQKYLKPIYNVTYSQIEYVAMFRQIQTKSHYMLLNNNWEIDSATSLVHDVLQMKNISLFALAPKTILFSPLKRFLNKQNRLFFFLNKQESNIIYTQTSFPTGRDSIASNNQTTFYQQLQENKKNFQKFLNQDDVIQNNEDLKDSKTKNVLFNLRIPKKKYEIIEEYETGIAEIYNRISYNEKYSDQLIIKTPEGQNRINKQEFIKRSKLYKFAVQNEKFLLIKRLFQKYTSTEESIDKILRVEGILKSFKTTQSLSYILIKIIRIELIEETQILQRQNTQFTTNLLEKQFTKSQMLQSINSKQQTQSQQSPKILHILTDQGDIQTNRDNMSRFLLPDNQINLDFEQLEEFQIINFVETNSDFLKEDTNKIEKTNSNLTSYIFISRLLFTFQILVASLCYFETSYFYNQKTVNSSIILIDYLFQYQIIVAESYNSQIDIQLFNNNITSFIINNQPEGYKTIDEFYSFNIEKIEKCADFMYFIFIEPDFLKMLYDNFYGYLSESGLDIQTLYQANLYLLNISQITYFKEEILGVHEFYKQYMLPLFQTVIQDSMIVLFDQGQQDQESQYTSYIILLTFQSFIQLLILFLLIKYQIQISKQYNALFRVQALIPYNQKLMIIDKIHLVIRQFCYITKYEYGNIQEFIQGNRQLNQESVEPKSNKDYQKVKEINTPLKVGFIPLPMSSVISPIIIIIIANILLIGVILVTGIIIIFMIVSNVELFSCNQFMMNNGNIWVIPAIKEILTQKLYPNYKFNDTQALNLLREFQYQIESDNPSYYHSNIEEINNIIDSNICDNDTLLNLPECQLLLDGSLTRGIRQYDYILSQVVKKILQPTDDRYENITYEKIYQFNKLYYFVLDHYLLSKDIWIIHSKEKISYHDEINLIFLVLIFFSIFTYFIIFNEFFYIKQKKQEYQFMKRFYKSFIPNSVMNHQKRSRAELIKYGFIKK